MPYPAEPVTYSNGYTDRPPSLSQLLWSEDGLGAPYSGDIRFDPTAPALKIVFGPNSLWADIEELFENRAGTPFSASGPRTYTRRFRVRTRARGEFGNAILMGPNAIAQCPGIPRPFSPYIPYRTEEWDLKALATQIQCDQELKDDSMPWIVTVTYSTDMPPGGPTFGYTGLGWHATSNHNQPWNLPVVAEYDTETYTEYPTYDLNGKPMVNSAGMPYFPTPGILRGDRVLTLTRNERFFESRAIRYEYSTNSLPFVKGRTYPIGYAYCMGSRATQMWVGPTEFWRVTYKILLRDRVETYVGSGEYNPAFNPVKILNAGMYQKIPIFGIGLIPITMPKMGQQVSQPVLLNAVGLKQTEVTLVGPNAGQLKQTFKEYKLLPTTNLMELLNIGA